MQLVNRLSKLLLFLAAILLGSGPLSAQSLQELEQLAAKDAATQDVIEKLRGGMVAYQDTVANLEELVNRKFSDAIALATGFVDDESKALVKGLALKQANKVESLQGVVKGYEQSDTLRGIDSDLREEGVTGTLTNLAIDFVPYGSMAAELTRIAVGGFDAFNLKSVVEEMRRDLRISEQRTTEITNGLTKTRRRNAERALEIANGLYDQWARAAVATADQAINFRTFNPAQFDTQKRNLDDLNSRLQKFSRFLGATRANVIKSSGERFLRDIRDNTETIVKITQDINDAGPVMREARRFISGNQAQRDALAADETRIGEFRDSGILTSLERQFERFDPADGDREYAGTFRVQGVGPFVGKFSGLKSKWERVIREEIRRRDDAALARARAFAARRRSSGRSRSGSGRKAGAPAGG